MSQQDTRPRAFALVDGFNLYHAIDDFVKHDHAKWLNIVSLIEGVCVLKSENLRMVHFFTAIPPWSNEKKLRHETLLDVYKELSVNVVSGKFKETTGRCLGSCRQEFPVYEEKQTDINMAIALARIAKDRLCSVAVLITGDSDQVPAIAYAREVNPDLKIRLVLPPNRHAKELTALCPDHIRLNADHFFRHRLPDEYPRRAGGVIKCPSKWRAQTGSAAV